MPTSSKIVRQNVGNEQMVCTCKLTHN